MSKPIISVENLGKSYLIGHESSQREPYHSLRDSMMRKVKDFGRKAIEFPMQSRGDLIPLENGIK